MSTTASFVIDFGSKEDAYLVAELDDVRNNDKTSFSTGDNVYFRIYADSAFSIEVTDGSVTDITSGVLEQLAVKDEVLSFIKGEPAGTTKRCVSVDSTTWFGNNLGAITPNGVTGVQCADASPTSLGIATINYTTEYEVFNLSPPAVMTEVYHILVYIKVL